MMNFTSPKSNVGSKASQHVIFNDMDQAYEYSEDGEPVKFRLEQLVPNTQHLIQKKFKPTAKYKTNERRGNYDHFGFRAFDVRYKDESQRLRNGGLDIDRSISRVSRDRIPVASAPSIRQSSVPFQYKDTARSRKPCLPSILEEHSSTSRIEKSKPIIGRISPRHPSGASSNFRVQRSNASPTSQSYFNRQYSPWLLKRSFQRDIAKTSDDYASLQQRAHLINEQKRSIQQQLKRFLH